MKVSSTTNKNNQGGITMENWKVYCYTSPSGKKYIGITGRTLEDRAGKNGCNYIKDGYAFGKAIEKYGWENFTREILEDNLTRQDAGFLEQYYIDYYDTYKNGYNETKGGDGNRKADYDLIIKLWNEGKSIQEIREETGYGRRALKAAFDCASISGIERIKRQAGQYHITTVYQYDLDGNYLNEYNSTTEAEEKTKIYHSNIIACIKGRRPTAGGFQWSNEKKDNIGKAKIKAGFHKELYQYDLNGNLLNTYPSVAEASRQTGYGKEYLARQAKKQSKAYGYIWSYEEFI